MSKLIGTDPNQVPSNADLGNLAYADRDNMPQISAKWVDVFNPNGRQSNLELHSSDFYRDSGDADLAYNWRFTNEGNVNRLRLMGYNPNMSPANIFPLYVEGDTQDIVTTGNIRMSNGKGIDFSATGNSSGTMTSEVLDDYEEGTFSPTVTFTGSGSPSSYFNAVGHYTKVGQVVHLTFGVGVNWTSASGSIRIENLPFTESVGGGYREPGMAIGNTNYTGNILRVAVIAGTNTLITYKGGNGVQLDASDFSTAFWLHGSLTYHSS